MFFGFFATASCFFPPLAQFLPALVSAPPPSSLGLPETTLFLFRPFSSKSTVRSSYPSGEYYVSS